MSNSFKPENYNAVSPYFIVDGARDFIDFLVLLFDAEEVRRYDNENGSIMHAEVKIDDSIVMVADANEKYPPTSFWMHVYVPDALKTYQRAIKSGCIEIEAPVRKDGDSDLRGTFKDKAGNFWAIGTQNL